MNARLLTLASSTYRVLLLSGLLVAHHVPRLLAQQANDSATNAPKSLCFKGKPLPACQAFVLTDFSLSLWLGAEPPGENPPPAVSEFGFMRNIGTSSALGGSFFVDVAHQEAVGGLALRYRYWFNSNTGLDVGLGTPIVGYAALDWATVKARLSYWDIGPVTRLELGQSTTYWSVGVEAGSGVGVIGTVAASVFALATLIAWAANN